MKIRSDIKELLTKVMKVHIVQNGQYARPARADGCILTKRSVHGVPLCVTTEKFEYRYKLEKKVFECEITVLVLLVFLVLK